MRLDLCVQRFLHGSDSTLGELFIASTFFCFTCEDEFRSEKVPGETRIPEGEYEVKLRTVDSPMNQRYAKRFDFHAGMMWLQDVPNFSNVYIHVGNTDDDTSGCLLVGLGAETCLGGGAVLQSVAAYKRLYPIVVEAIRAGQKVFLTIRDKA
ncbi:hypothetical protein HBA55_34955 [Pseudomaricurvus alkylphenolicus]|uniref:DUF5675 family protein n=1 Tax=Pseudomaricurvus alkylphenolicus TaxID=1306991 RepID=UPI001423468A|nr:DUF5675 family protein [Pseudomaricurvus alkylphenolicus]NIB44833.1 hypothetical protein [Pseudomaricurvus alkylphenolicus]